MRVWTVQAPQVLAALRAGTVWRASEARIEPHWLPAYRWMAREMRNRLGAPRHPRQMPVWVWCQWRGLARRKPDLRCSGHLPPGTAGVRLELELEDARVLCTDFELWHYALNGWYLPDSLDDDRDLDAHRDRRQIESSWRHIFDLAWCSRHHAATRAQQSLQGVTWELRPEDLRQVTRFVAR